MNSAHLPFPQPIYASRPINTLLRVRNAATLVERKCFLESAKQARLRRRSTVRQQQRSSYQRFFVQMHQYLLNDHRIFYAGNDPGWSSTDSAPLNINLENPLQPLRPGYCHGWHVCRFCRSIQKHLRFPRLCRLLLLQQLLI